MFAVSNFYTKNDIFTHLFQIQVQASDRVLLDFFFVSTGWEEFDNKEKIEDFEIVVWGRLCAVWFSLKVWISLGIFFYEQRESQRL